MRVELIPIEGIDEVSAGADLAALILDAARAQGSAVEARDVVVITQKVVSKAEGRVVPLDTVAPSPLSFDWAERHGVDARVVELVLRETRRIVRMDRGIIISETRHGFVCANAGVDVSNVDGGASATLLPADPDESARKVRDRIRAMVGHEVAVVICDTFGRPWREGQVNVAIGVAGIEPVTDYAGAADPHGYRMRASAHAVADEVAAAAGLVSAKLRRVPAVLARGVPFNAGGGSILTLARHPQHDLFR